MKQSEFWLLLGIAFLAVANGTRNDLVSAMAIAMIPLCIITVVFGGRE